MQAGMQFVSRHPETADSAPPCWAEEPVFWADSYRGTRFDHIANRRRLARFLARRVSRDPNNLHAHLQRIGLHMDGAEEAALFGALVDLFLALGNRGHALRKRMFMHTIGRLKLEHAKSLRGWLDSGLHGSDELPLAPFSILGRSQQRSGEVVARSRASNQGDRDLIGEVRDLIDSGQIDAARSALEAALLENTADTRLSAELLELYGHTQDSDSFLRMLERLHEVDPELAATWEAMRDLFSFG